MINNDADRCRRQKPIDVQFTRGNALEKVNGFKQNPVRGWIRPQGERTVTALGTENQVHGSGNHRVIPSQETDILPRESFPTIAAYNHAPTSERRKCIDEHAFGAELKRPWGEFVGLDAVVIEDTEHKVIK